jgi:hypothetical protein
VTKKPTPETLAAALAWDAQRARLPKKPPPGRLPPSPLVSAGALAVRRDRKHGILA